VTDDLSCSSMIPIPKGRNSSTTSSSNYRAITLSSIFGKLFDYVVLNRYGDLIGTSHLQFGFKKKHSATMCSLILKETIEYYNCNSSSVFCVMLDATKAFDRVEYCKLFRKLLDKKLPVVIVRFLLNMYISHKTHVTWNGCESQMFNVNNGVKQGGVLSPVLFCLYIDGLLALLKSSGFGCHIGNMFAGALAYADDLVLIAPTPFAMRTMLHLCERYADDFNVAFNGNKSKCIISHPHNSHASRFKEVSFSMSGNVIENVDNWLHLGYNISNDRSDKVAISNCRSSFIGQANNVICWFNVLDCDIKCKLLKTYCSSLYGCELWNLTCSDVQTVCKAWRQALRRVWNLPYNCHTAIIENLSGNIPIFDFICTRNLNFIKNCLCSDNLLVNFVVKHGVFFSRMWSCVGRNVQFCCERYGLCMLDLLDLPPKQKLSTEVDNDIEMRVGMIKELMNVRDGKMTLSGDMFSLADVRGLIDFLCSY